MFLILLLMLTPVIVLAGGGEGIPVKFLLAQIFNFTLFVVILFLLLRKKLPSFLRQKQEDFLAYRKKAKDLEQKHREESLYWQDKIHQLTDKQKNLKKAVAEAIHHKEQEMTQDMSHRLKSLKNRAEQSLKLMQVKEISRLRKGLLSQVILHTKEQIQSSTPVQQGAFNHQDLQKWKPRT